MTEFLNWGLLSTARINGNLIAGVRASKHSRVAAVASRDLGKAREFAQKFDIPNPHGTYEDLLADPRIDVIYNPLPNHLHTEWTIKALNAGKHVLVEKPIALSVSDVRAIAEAGRMNGKYVAEAFMYRHHPQTAKVQDLVASGEIGELRFIQGTYSYILNRPADIRWNPAYGGGSIWDVGCYPLSYTRMITGSQPISVHGFQVQSDSGVDLTFSGQLQYSNGVISQFHSSFGMPLKAFMEIQGTNGTISVQEPFKPQDSSDPLILRHDNGEKEFHFQHGELYAGEVEDMENAILNSQPLHLSLQESEDNIATIVALLESAHTGHPVNL